MPKISKYGQENILFKGKIFEVIEQPMMVNGSIVNFEIAKRSPGVRLIIVKGDKILMSREYREELSCYDYRLPGGKVFDSLDEYINHTNEDILPFAIKAAKLECLQETGIIAKNIKHYITSKSGSTVIWDLYYFIIDEFDINPEGQSLENGEEIEVIWKSFEEIKVLCQEGLVNEDRSLGILFRFFSQYPKIYA